MKEYLIFYNGFSWTCEIEDEDEKVIGHVTEDSPLTALAKALEFTGEEYS